MNKTELVREVAGKVGVTQKDTAAILDAIVESIKGAVASGDEIAIGGFGKFCIYERGEHKGVNPATGETITIPAKKSPKFKPSSVFKDEVNA